MALRVKKIIEHPVLSAVVASLILSFLGWIGGVFPPIGVWGNKAIELFKGNLAIPTWVVLVLFFMIVSLVVYFVIVTLRLNSLEKQLKKNEAKQAISRVTQALVENAPLGEKEKGILSFHAEMPINYGMTASEVEKKFKLHREEAQYFLEKLESEEYIKYVFKSDTDESAYQLSKKGRGYLVENKLLKNEEKNT